MSTKRLPSLSTRVVWTLSLAILALFVVIAVYIAQGYLRDGTGEVDRNLLAFASSTVRSLADVEREDEARRVVLALDRIAKDSSEGTRDPPSDLVLTTATGRVVFAPDGVNAAEMGRLHDGLNVEQLHGRRMSIYVKSVGPWRLAVVDDRQRRDRVIVEDLLMELGQYLLLAIPMLLLPVWLAVRAGLAPLQRLSDQVAQRAPGDLQPLRPEKGYRELAPLVDALNDLLRRLSHSLEREKAFVHDAAHEMRTPLAVISTQAHLLSAAEPGKRDEAQRRLDNAVARASHLTHQLLRLAQMDARDQSMRRTVDLMALVRDSVADGATRGVRSGADIVLSGPDTLVLHTDPHAVQSIVENLLDNALRYAGRQAHIGVAVERSPAGLQITVEDDGPGVHAVDRATLFERFRRGAKESTPGAGLGLAIVAQAARSLGGSVELAPNGRLSGCRFVVRLPASEPPAASAPASVAARPAGEDA